ncbi:hypothetical protein A2U01_0116290, partial [Trifolium medium]|nr:hypothetical protein [Trifolium medium]
HDSPRKRPLMAFFLVGDVEEVDSFSSVDSFLGNVSSDSVEEVESSS